MKKLRVDIWSDIACPWCYVGKRRFEGALARFELRDEVSVVWRSFELDTSAPLERPLDVSYAERLAKKYSTSVREAQAMIDRMVSVAGAEGITMRFDIIRSGNTFDAHRLLHFAHERGRQDALKERLFQAYFVEGQPIGDKDTNCRLAVDVGLDGKEARAVLGGDAFASEVRADEERARANGISGVPFFVFDQKYGLSGAQPPTTLLRFLEKTWSELPEQEETGAQEAMVCGPEGCA